MNDYTLKVILMREKGEDIPVNDIKEDLIYFIYHLSLVPTVVTRIQ